MGISISGSFSAEFEAKWQEMQESIKQQMISRSYRGSNELRNAEILVLRGQRSGRRYKVPGTFKRQRDKKTGKMRNGRYYTASAPGEPPANRTGMFRMTWFPEAKIGTEGSDFSVISEIYNETTVPKGYLLGELLEDGTSKMAPRPHHERIQEEALPNVMRIYSEPYF